MYTLRSDKLEKICKAATTLMHVVCTLGDSMHVRQWKSTLKNQDLPVYSLGNWM